MDIIVAFSLDEGLGHVRNWMPKTIFPMLGEDCTTCSLRCVTFKAERTREVGLNEDRSRSEVSFEGGESEFLRDIPLPRNILLGEIIQWTGHMRKAGDKCTVEVAKS